MPTRNVNLTDHWDRFVQAGIDSGRFSNASEVVREGLRLLEQRERAEEAKLAWLRGAVQEGIDAIERGDFVDIRSEQDLDKMFREIDDEIERERTVPKKSVGRKRAKAG